MAEHNLASAFYRNWTAHPERLALHVGGKDHTYGEVGLLAGRIATRILGSGLAPGGRVGVLATRSLTAVAGILGACWAGMTYVPLNTKFSEGRNRSIISNAGLGALILDDGGLKSLTPETLEVCPPLVLTPCAQGRELAPGLRMEGQEDLEGLEPAGEPAPVPAQGVAYLLYTSGTTGEPKGVMVTNGNLRYYLDFMRGHYDLGPDDRMSQHSEITFDVSVFDMFVCWQAGASLHVVPENMIMAPAEFIRRRALTVWVSVPSVIAFMKSMGQLKPGAFPTLRITLFCGEALLKEMAELWLAAAPNTKMENGYGPTETTVTSFWQSCDPPFLVTPSRGIVAVGKPNEGMLADIVDPGNRFLKAGEVGEIAESGPQIATGYWGLPELTEKRFPHLVHPEHGPGRWYLTGDLGYKDEHGVFHCLGRVDNQVKVMGYRIELDDVEFHLREVCGAGVVSVVAWPVENGAAVGLVGFVTEKPLGTQEIKERLRKRIPSYMIPRQVLQVEHMPLSLNGKTDRKALIKMLDDNAERARK